MKSTHWMTTALIVGAMSAVGCAGTTPMAPATAPAADADRQVLAVDDLASLEAAFAQMPARISAADAATMLVEVDESKVAPAEGAYSVAQIGTVRYGPDDNDNDNNRWRNRNRGDNDNNNRWRSQSRDRDRDHDRARDRDRDRDHFRRSGWGDRRHHSRYDDFRYYRSGNYLLPYYFASGYYHPYANVYDAVTSSLYSPYLYGYGGIYSPYSYLGGLGAYGGYGGYGQVATAQNVVVNIQSYQYMPSTIRVMRNGTVTFRNLDAVPHTATSTTGGWDTGNIAVGQTSQSMVFATPGTYPFYCRYHPQMTGTIIVE